MEPTFDRDGYPSEETLRTIATWEAWDKEGWFEFIRSAWYYPEYFTNNDGKITMSTGGWSGNEDIISAMEENRVLWAFIWASSRRGGHYEFDITNEPRMESNKV